MGVGGDGGGGWWWRSLLDTRSAYISERFNYFVLHEMIFANISGEY